MMNGNGNSDSHGAVAAATRPSRQALSPQPVLPTLSYGVLSGRMHERIVSERIPADGTFELTYRCNLACVQCYCVLPAGDPEALRKELTTAEAFRILDEMAEAGCLWLLMTGGEILLRPDFLGIYAHAKRRGLLLTLFTNGIGITEEVADALAAEPPFAVEITLYGATEETYLQVTKKPLGLSRTLAGMDRLMARRIPPSLKATILRENVHELAAMRAIAKARGLDFRFTAELTPRIDRPGEPIGKRVGPEEALELDRADPARWEELRRVFTTPDRARLFHKSPNLFICQAGTTGFNVNPYGRLLFCPDIEPLGADLRKTSFREAWAGFEKIRETPARAERACNNCELNIACGICAGSAYLERGDAQAGIDFHHRLARLRAEAFGLRLKETGKGAWVLDDTPQAL